MSPRTVFLSRLIGLYSILISLSMIARKQATVEAVMALVHNSPLLLLLGVMTVVAGLAMILSHNVWSGGALPVVVTLIGWWMLIKGLLFFFLTPEQMGIFLERIHYEQFFYPYIGISLLLGMYLSYGGLKGRLAE